MSIACDVIACGRLVERLERPFFWIDAFACPPLFSWNTGKSVSRDVIPKSSKFSAEHYATLVAYLALFHKYSKPFLCLVGLSQMDLLSFIQTVDPTKVRIGERLRDEDEPNILETTVECVVLLLLAAPARSLSELEASVDKLFDEGKWDDHRALGGPTIGGKSQSSIKRLFAGAVKNAEVRGGVMPTLPFVTSFVSTTPEREGEDYIELLAGANLNTIGAPTSVPITTRSDFLIGGIRTGIDPDSNLQKVYVPQWNVTNGSCLDDDGVCCEMVDEFAPSPKFFASVRGKEHEQLFTEFNVGAARQMPLSAKVRMHAVYNIKERRRLNSIVEEKDALLKAKDKEIGSLKVQLVLKKAEATENDNLVDQVHKLEASSAELQEKVTAYENGLSQLEKFQDDRMREMNDKFDKLDTNLVEMALHLEERFYPHLLTTIYGLRWLLTYGLELVITRCFNSTEYLSTFGVAIGKAVEKGTQDELSIGITHGAEGRVLTDVITYNPSAEANYLSALQHLQSVNFCLITELKSNKDASIDTIINLLRLEDSLAEKLGLTESQPNVDQLMVPIHHSLDQRVVGASALSLSLDVSSFRVHRIKENIAKHRSTLRDVFIPLSEPLSITAGTESTLNVIPATVDTTTALSVTSIYASLIPSISSDDYEITHAEGEKSIGADANPFPDVDDAELNIP
nr:hypothetical protein [Tanacetum cinerariifolium]